MKANEAPEKIYINDFGSELSYDWHTEHCCESDIEYTRTDAFIEKACEWLFNQANFYTKVSIDPNNGGVHTDFYADKLIEDFRKYMERE